MLDNITVERLQEIERLRDETAATGSFQKWMMEFKVGRLAKKHNDRAVEMMAQWEPDFRPVVAKLN